MNIKCKLFILNLIKYTVGLPLIFAISCGLFLLCLCACILCRIDIIEDLLDFYKDIFFPIDEEDL